MIVTGRHRPELLTVKSSYPVDSMVLRGLAAAVLISLLALFVYSQTPAAGGDIIPIRQVSDPYPVFNGIAIDPDTNLVAMTDVNRKSLLSYARADGSRRGEITPPRHQIFGPLTNVGFVAGIALDPQRKEIALGVRHYLNDLGPASEEPLLGQYLSQEAAFQCTTCGACEFQCPVGVQHLPIIIGLRRGAVNTGKWDNDYGNKLFLNLERYGNALGFSSGERDKFVRKQELPAYDGTQEYCLWLGCMGG